MVVEFKFILAFIVYLFRKGNRDIWLIGERRDEAKDNGFSLFNYIRNFYPDEEIFYVISKKSQYKHKLMNLGNAIELDSFKHMCFFLEANKLIMPFESSTLPTSKIVWLLYRLKWFRKKVIYIKHGIIKEKLEHLVYNKRFKFDLFACTVPRERDFLIDYMGYPKHIVQLLGMARYDNLIDLSGSNNNIFFMPTWRKWMSNYTIQEFLESDYFRNVKSLLTNDYLISYLENNNLYLNLYLHNGFQKYSSLFQVFCKQIIINTNDNSDVQEMLKTSKVLITDYSSVAFDFAYMNKIVFYYQFDSVKYNDEHFFKGYFDYNIDSFGPVCEDANDLSYKLVAFLSGEAKFEDYEKRAKEFFLYRDTNNCERIYKAIKII